MYKQIIEIRLRFGVTNRKLICGLLFIIYRLSLRRQYHSYRYLQQLFTQTCNNRYNIIFEYNLSFIQSSFTQNSIKL